MDAEEPEFFAPEPGEWCDCCPHALAAAETLASLIYHSQQALDQQNQSTEVMKEAVRCIDFWKAEATTREQEIEAMALEIYELKARLISAQKRYNAVANHMLNMTQFLAALGYTDALKTTEDVEQA